MYVYIYIYIHIYAYIYREREMQNPRGAGPQTHQWVSEVDLGRLCPEKETVMTTNSKA